MASPASRAQLIKKHYERLHPCGAPAASAVTDAQAHDGLWGVVNDSPCTVCWALKAARALRQCHAAGAVQLFWTCKQ